MGMGTMRFYKASNPPPRITSLSWPSAIVLAAMLAACGQDNQYVAPPPPQVTVMLPVSQTVTRYLETTGNAAPVNSANLVARVQGFVHQIHYREGDVVRQGA